MKPETPNASHATPHFWREMRMKTLQARLGHLRSPAVTGCLRKTPASHPEAIFNEDSNNNNNNNCYYYYYHYYY